MIELLFIAMGGAAKVQIPAAEPTALTIGQKAPPFALPDETGKIHRLVDYKGRTVVLMFYPKDFTPGCTGQVRSIRTQGPQLTNDKIVVFGISTDSVATHSDFARKEQLKFSLLSSDKTMLTDYGALAAGGLAKRMTVVVGPDQTVRVIDGTLEAQFMGKTPDGMRISRHGENLSLLLSDWKAEVGATVPNFFLPDADGNTISPYKPGSKATVIVFLGTQCEVSRRFAPALVQMAVKPSNRHVAFFAIDPNKDAQPDALKAFGKSLALPFPLAYDPFGEVVTHFKPEVTPCAWVLNVDGKVVYHGAITAQKVGREWNFVQEALDAVLTGRPVAVTHAEAQGTSVHREKN
jgi:thioredoxin-dependent peroxiredoxin